MSDFYGRKRRPDPHIDDAVQLALNDVLTPESKPPEPKKRKDINLLDPIPRKSGTKGPLEEAQERQGSSNHLPNKMKQQRMENHPFERPQTSHGRKRERSNNTYDNNFVRIPPAFRARCTKNLKDRSSPAKRGDHNDDHAHDLGSSTGTQRAEAQVVDLYQQDATYSSHSPTMTEVPPQPFIYRPGERDADLDADSGADSGASLSPSSVHGSMASSSHARQASSAIFSATILANNSNTSSPEACRSKNTICLSLDDDGSQNVSNVLANISLEPYIPKSRASANRSFLPGLPAVNAPTRKRPVGVKTSTGEPKPSLGPQRTFSFTKANGKPQRPKGSRITPGASFAPATGSKSRTTKRRTFASIECADPFKDSDDDPLDDSDDEYRGNGAKNTTQTWGYKEHRRTNYSSSSISNKRAKSELISIDGSDDEIEVKSEKKLKTRRQPTLEFPLARLSVGKRYSSSKCKLTIDSHNERLSLTYTIGTLNKDFEHIIGFDDVEEIKYAQMSTSLDDTEELSLLFMRVKPTGKNNLKSAAGSYLQDGREEDSAKKFIVLDLRNEEGLGQLRKVKFFNRFFDNNSNKLQDECVEQYATTLLERIKQEVDSRRKSVGSPQSTRSKSKTKRGTKSSDKPNDVLVVFPFGAKEEVIDAAGESLHEASIGCSWNMEDGILSCTAEPDSDEHDESNDETENTSSRAHYLTVRHEDRDRLEVGEFLNDTLIDFWMQWMRRKENVDESRVHIFTSHFYTALAEGGPQSVESWTAKKNIDIFSKRMIFIPINKSLHWSLCVVVNAKEIGQMYQDRDENAPRPCILFFDALKAHKKQAVAKKVIGWLNAEWKRLGKTASSIDDPQHKTKPFDNCTMQVVAPRIPYQNNSWDCGVFVCRYAYGLFKTRNHKVYTEGDFSESFLAAITNSSEFSFDMGDIARIRVEFGTLIDRLSTSYKHWKEEKRKKDEKKDDYLKLVKEEPAEGVSFV